MKKDFASLLRQECHGERRDDAICLNKSESQIKGVL